MCRSASCMIRRPSAVTEKFGYASGRIWRCETNFWTKSEIPFLRSRWRVASKGKLDALQRIPPKPLAIVPTRRPVSRLIERPSLKVNSMQNLSPRHVKMEEAHRLGVQSGWYSTKVSGTFVSGPHDSESACLRKIAEINAPSATGKA